MVAAYVWTSRLYNGDFLTYPNSHEVLAALVNLSSFLRQDAVFTSFQHALADVSLNACHVRIYGLNTKLCLMYTLIHNILQ